MPSKNHCLLFFFLLIITITHAQTNEVKYYNLVIDKLELPSCSKDTTASGWIRINIAYDDDRVVDHWEYVTISTKSPVIAINKKIFDIKREDKINFWVKFTETGVKKPEGYESPNSPTINNLKLEYEGKFSAISEGRRYFKSIDTYYWQDFTKYKDDYASVILYWHLEPSKLQ
ncbi:MAG TPA: hypothetical protein VFV31_09760 [Chitinophagaceae bacterium]|nr:hypothetical protein [Chitinophagaceae bacterium]